MSFIKSTWQQYFPQAPTFTENEVPPGSQKGKVFLITGANQGIGFELLKLLYPTGATIYVAGRSQERLDNAVEQIRKEGKEMGTPAVLKTLVLDLNDLSTIKRAAESFLQEEGEGGRLDVLWNNAALGGAPVGWTTKQGMEGHVGTNCVAPLLFTQLLLPILQRTAKKAPKDSVRIIWSGSLMIDTHSPKGGVDFDAIESGKTANTARDYAISKAGNLFLSVEAARRWGKDGIVSVCQNPGNLNTQAYRYVSKWLMMMLRPVLHPPKMGGYTLLFSGFSADVHNGCYIWPFGIVRDNVREDIRDAIEKGKAREFWEWCEKKYEGYA